ncbi:MAG: rRNA adenine N-6-methyltransferase family protein, partial [Dehalococcoidia bacterium]
MLTSRDVRALLQEHGIRPSRALGQNFLADPNTARRIVRLAGVEAGDRVLEIGPGIGSLTLALADAGARVHALELDRHLVPVLESVLHR